jgi:hypothetical protein
MEECGLNESENRAVTRYWDLTEMKSQETREINVQEVHSSYSS